MIYLKLKVLSQDRRLPLHLPHKSWRWGLLGSTWRSFTGQEHLVCLQFWKKSKWDMHTEDKPLVISWNFKVVSLVHSNTNWMYTKQGSVCKDRNGRNWALPSRTPAPILHRIRFWIVKLLLKTFKRKSFPILEARVESHQVGERSLTTKVKVWGQELVAGLSPVADLGPLPAAKDLKLRQKAEQLLGQKQSC